MNEEIAKMIEEEKERLKEVGNLDETDKPLPKVENEREDNIADIKNGAIQTVDKSETALADTSINDFQQSIVGEAMKQTQKTIIDKALPKINDEKIVEKHAKKLAENADESIRVELEGQELEIKKVDTKNKVTRKEISNQLYQLKQEGLRIKKEQRHLNELQKLAHKQENDKNYWEAHKDTLQMYNIKQGSNRTFCNILLWLDGLKGFFNGLGKVSTALVGALKWIIILALIIGVLLAVPVSREWLLKLLGFLK